MQIGVDEIRSLLKNIAFQISISLSFRLSRPSLSLSPFFHVSHCLFGTGRDPRDRNAYLRVRRIKRRLFPAQNSRTMTELYFLPFLASFSSTVFGPAFSFRPFSTRPCRLRTTILNFGAMAHNSARESLVQWLYLFASVTVG